MGDSWNAVLQGLMIGIAIQVTGSVLYVILTSLCKSMKERLSRPPGGESVDLERGSVNGGEGGSVADDQHPRFHEGGLELIEENMASLQNGTGSIRKSDNIHETSNCRINQVPVMEGV